MAYIKRIKSEKTTEIPLEGKQLTFGRDAENDVCVDKYRGISRTHCGFTKYEDGIITLTDFGSRNGTYVNGKKIFEEVRLKHRDEIIICEELQFQFFDYDSEAGKKELAEEEARRREEEERKKKAIVVKGDGEMSDAMSEMSNDIGDKDFKSMMDEILKPTKKKTAAPPPKKSLPTKHESDDPEKWVNTYEEIKIKRR